MPAEVVGGPLNLYVVESVNPWPGENTFMIPDPASYVSKPLSGILTVVAGSVQGHLLHHRQPQFLEYC